MQVVLPLHREGWEWLPTNKKSSASKEFFQENQVWWLHRLDSPLPKLNISVLGNSGQHSPSRVLLEPIVDSALVQLKYT